MSQACSYSENIGEWIRLPAGERGFAHALAVSAAVHAALLMLLFFAASAQVPGVAAPLGEGLIMAFLVPGNQAAEGKAAAPAGRKSRAPEEVALAAPPAQNAPVRNASVQGIAVQAAQVRIEPAESRDRHPSMAVRQPADGQGGRHDADPAASPAVAVSAPVLSGGAGRPEGKGEEGGAVRGGGSALSADAGALPTGTGTPDGGAGAGTPAARREGAGGAPQAGGNTRRPGEAHTFPRYGDNARPAYPPLARLRGYQGVVVLSVEVLADGRVGRVEIKDSAGHDILDRAALEAVRSWRFEPGRKEGLAVTMLVDVPVRFVLNESAVR